MGAHGFHYSRHSVAVWAGVATGAFCRRWSSKAELFGEIVATALARGVGVVRQIAEADPPREKLAAAIRTSARRALAGRKLGYAEQAVRINAVAPGQVSPKIMDLSAQAAGLSIRRMGSPEEFAAAVTWLASDEALFVFGHALRGRRLHDALSARTKEGGASDPAGLSSRRHA